MRPLLIALQFLTSLPLHLEPAPTPREIGASLSWYPLVGTLLGALLWLAGLALGDAPAPLQAALLLMLWVVASGALHLDGLADAADAWLGGLGNAERTLLIMKDPRSGPMAITVLVLVLLGKFAALWALASHDDFAPLLLAALLGRAALPALLLGTPYVRAGGLGQSLAEHLPRTAVKIALALWAAGILLLFGGRGLGALALAAAVFWLARRAQCRRLGGCTGDTAGATLELVETAVLMGLALSPGAP